MANSIQGSKDHDMFPGTPFRHIIKKQQDIPIYFEPVAAWILLQVFSSHFFKPSFSSSILSTLGIKAHTALI
jgi:hypothetical protein